MRSILLALSLASLASLVSAQDRFVLRDTTVLRDVRLADFDDDGVRLADGRTLGWDEVERATLVGGRQQEFDQRLAELGTPLYRLRQRLKVGDLAGLREHAEALAARYTGRTGDATQLVAQALFWSRLNAGERERALLPYLECCRQVRRRPALAEANFGPKTLRIDPRSGMTRELAPIWFDRDAARAVKGEAMRLAGEIEQPRPPAVYLYCAALALTAEDDGLAARLLQAVPTGDDEVGQLRLVIESQRELLSGRPGPQLTQLKELRDRLAPAARPLGLYVLGRGLVAQEQVNDGLLCLLRLPAAYGTTAPELSAAALYESMRVLERRGDAAGAVSVRRELLESYGTSRFAAAARE